jgi:hypothetical protein
MRVRQEVGSVIGVVGRLGRLKGVSIVTSRRAGIAAKVARERLGYGRGTAGVRPGLHTRRSKRRRTQQWR